MKKQSLDLLINKFTRLYEMAQNRAIELDFSYPITDWNDYILHIFGNSHIGIYLSVERLEDVREYNGYSYGRANIDVEDYVEQWSSDRIDNIYALHDWITEFYNYVR